MANKINLAEKLSQFEGHWQPRVVGAFNGHDLDGFAMTLHPEVELHAGRGVRVGRDLARLWATRTPGGVQQQILVEELRGAEDRVLALIVREWWWDDEEEETGTEPARTGSMPVRR